MKKNIKYQKLEKLQNTISIFESDSSLNALLSDTTTTSEMDVLSAISNYVNKHSIEVYRIEKPIVNNDNAITIKTIPDAFYRFIF